MNKTFVFLVAIVTIEAKSIDLANDHLVLQSIELCNKMALQVWTDISQVVKLALGQKFNFIKI